MRKEGGEFSKAIKREVELSLIDQQISFLNDKIEELDIKKEEFFNLNPKL